jgi:flagellar FliJ protein
MARFVFKLQGVLRHRAAIERERLREFALVQAKLKGLEDQLKMLNQSMQETNDDVRRNRLTGRLDLGFITAHRRFLMGMQRRAVELVAAVAGVQKELEAARLALAEAAKQRKVLEKLRERQEQRWREEVSRKELIAADEVATQLSHGQGRT